MKANRRYKTHYRDATVSDLEAIAKIFNHYIQHSNAVAIRAPMCNDQIMSWFQKIRGDGFPFLVADIGGRVVGFAYASRFASGKSFDPAIESHVYVTDEMWRRGVGRVLLEALIGCARTLKCRTMIARIDGANIGSIRLHQKCGFSFVGTLRDVGYKNGKFVSSTYMQILFEGEFHFD